MKKMRKREKKERKKQDKKLKAKLQATKELKIVRLFQIKVIKATSNGSFYLICAFYIESQTTRVAPKNVNLADCYGYVFISLENLNYQSEVNL